jgi:Set1/Ash2 histone methyltransferase complex subunit ASH2
VRLEQVEPKKEALAEDPSRVQLSRVGKAAQLVLSEDRLSVTGHKGFRTVRASHGAHEGSWYCEVTMTHLGSTGHARVGWCTRQAELQAPVGFDQHGYRFRDVDGSKVHQGLRQAYGQQGFKEGDVVSGRRGMWCDEHSRSGREMAIGCCCCWSRRWHCVQISRWKRSAMWCES